ncbi:MAG: ABC transporter ATP-binding protein [Calditrichia bacterium]
MLHEIELNKVSKRYSKNAEPALDNFNLRVSPGERLGIIGANGSGKSTLLKLLLRFIIRDSGTIRIHGESDLETARRFIGYVPERQEGLENFTPAELLTSTAKMHSITDSNRRISEVLEFVELTDASDFLLSSFSKGMIQRVQLAIALLHRPPILLLDEPTSGLDPDGKKKLRELLLKLENVTILYASHNLEELESLCNSVILLHKGKLIKQFNLQDDLDTVLSLDITAAALSIIEQQAAVSHKIVQKNDDELRIELTGGDAEVQHVLARLSKAGVEAKRLRSRSVLEELYAKYVLKAPESKK